MQGLFGSKFHNSEDSFSLRLNGFTKIGLCTTISIVTLIMGDWGSLAVLLFGSSIFAITQLRFKILAIAYALVTIVGAISVGFALIMGIIISHYRPGVVDYSLFTMILPLMRILIVLQVVIVTALSTSPQEILMNLKSIKFPRFLYLPVLVMLRFIPSFIHDLKQIRESLETRGLRITPLSIIFHPVLTMRCSIFPLIFRALRSSDELAIASELKGVGYSKKVTSFKKHSFHIDDTVMIFMIILFLSFSFRIFWDAPQQKNMRSRGDFSIVQTGRNRTIGFLRFIKQGGIDVIYDEQQLYMNAFEKPKKRKRTHKKRK